MLFDTTVKPIEVSLSNGVTYNAARLTNVGRAGTISINRQAWEYLHKLYNWDAKTEKYGKNDLDSQLERDGLFELFASRGAKIMQADVKRVLSISAVMDLIINNNTALLDQLYNAVIKVNPELDPDYAETLNILGDAQPETRDTETGQVITPGDAIPLG